MRKIKIAFLLTSLLVAAMPLLAWGQESYTIPVNEVTTDLGGR